MAFSVVRVFRVVCVRAELGGLALHPQGRLRLCGFHVDGRVLWRVGYLRFLYIRVSFVFCVDRSGDWVSVRFGVVGKGGRVDGLLCFTPAF